MNNVWSSKGRASAARLACEASRSGSNFIVTKVVGGLVLLPQNSNDELGEDQGK